MQARRDETVLVHLADSVTELSTQMEDHRVFQQNVLAVLHQLLAANETQTEMLAEILSAAQQEPGPSPVAKTLEALLATVRELAENQATLVAHIAGLPEAIAQAIALKAEAEIDPEED